jgi:mRNA interferase RelE/StbE
MNYHVEVPAKVEKYILSLPIKIALQITERINLLAENPRPTNSIKLEGQEGYRIKSGNYRVIYEIDDKAKIVYVLSVRDRKDAYKKR